MSDYQDTQPAHDATGVIWGSILGLLLWPLLAILAMAAFFVFL